MSAWVSNNKILEEAISALKDSLEHPPEEVKALISHSNHEIVEAYLTGLQNQMKLIDGLKKPKPD